VYDETICEEIGQYRRFWKFDCGCLASGVFTKKFSSCSGIWVDVCDNHSPPDKLDFVWESEFNEWMNSVFGEDLEFEVESEGTE
jgi:hypothetical protein